jgi:hypothetical protein
MTFDESRLWHTRRLCPSFGEKLLDSVADAERPTHINSALECSCSALSSGP